MRKLILAIASILFISLADAQYLNVGVGTSTPDSSAVLEARSSTQGFLPPRMTQSQRNGIVRPVAGLMVWCMNCGAGELQVYNGKAWTNMVGGLAADPAVAICNQVWSQKNLDVSMYRNGDPIPRVDNAADWEALTTGAYCYYNNDSATYAATYGKLYNWYAVNDSRGLAPAGWHIPTDAEWSSLGTCLGGGAIAGGALRETGTANWWGPNTSATNSSGFTGLPGGIRIPNGQFLNLGPAGFFWTSTQSSTSDALYRYFVFNSTDLSSGGFGKQAGQSVRLLKD